MKLLTFIDTQSISDYFAFQIQELKLSRKNTVQHCDAISLNFFENLIIKISHSKQLNQNNDMKQSEFECFLFSSLNIP